MLCINFHKNALGYILGDFFTNSFGHPACSTDKPMSLFSSAERTTPMAENVIQNVGIKRQFISNVSPIAFSLLRPEQTLVQDDCNKSPRS
jgi:hypothetical protein